MTIRDRVRINRDLPENFPLTMLFAVMFPLLDARRSENSVSPTGWIPWGCSYPALHPGRGGKDAALAARGLDPANENPGPEGSTLRRLLSDFEDGRCLLELGEGVEDASLLDDLGDSAPITRACKEALFASGNVARAAAGSEGGANAQSVNQRRRQLHDALQSPALRAAALTVPDASLTATAAGAEEAAEALRIAGGLPPPNRFEEPAGTISEERVSQLPAECLIRCKALTPQEARQLSALLAVPWMRVPAALAFFSAKPTLLLHAPLRALLHGVLFAVAPGEGAPPRAPPRAPRLVAPPPQPGDLPPGLAALDHLALALGPHAGVPLPPGVRPEALGPVSGLLEELAHAPAPILAPLVALARDCLGRVGKLAPCGTMQQLAVLLWLSKLLARVEGALADVLSAAGAGTRAEAAQRAGAPATGDGAEVPLSALHLQQQQLAFAVEIGALQDAVVSLCCKAIEQAQRQNDVALAVALFSHVAVVLGERAPESLCGSSRGAAAGAPLEEADVATAGYGLLIAATVFVSTHAHAVGIAVAEAGAAAGAASAPAPAAAARAREEGTPSLAVFEKRDAGADVLRSIPWAEVFCVCLRAWEPAMAWLAGLRGARLRRSGGDGALHESDAASWLLSRLVSTCLFEAPVQRSWGPCPAIPAQCTAVVESPHPYHPSTVRPPPHFPGSSARALLIFTALPLPSSPLPDFY